MFSLRCAHLGCVTAGKRADQPFFLDVLPGVVQKVAQTVQPPTDGTVASTAHMQATAQTADEVLRIVTGVRSTVPIPISKHAGADASLQVQAWPRTSWERHWILIRR